MMHLSHLFPRWLMAIGCLTCAACAHQTPTIAHIHVGHAITGAHNTPGKVGYFTVAESQARLALAAAKLALSPSNSVEDIKLDIQVVNELTNERGEYPLTKALREAADHIEFAALSEDASPNIIAGYKEFRSTITGVLYRGARISEIARVLEQVTTDEEARFLAQEAHTLAQANLSGSDDDGDGVLGNKSSELGIVQIAQALEELIDREDPAYTTVDRWYLFNLIRLPNGDWIFKRAGGGGSRGAY